MAHKAKAGGEIGANGEFYKGGQFVADNPNTAKGSNPKKSQHKIQIEPYKWVVADADEFPIMNAAGIGTVSKFDDTYDIYNYQKIVLADDAEYLCKRNGWNLEQIKNFIARYNAGERVYRK